MLQTYLITANVDVFIMENATKVGDDVGYYFVGTCLTLKVGHPCTAKMKCTYTVHYTAYTNVGLRGMLSMFSS